MSHANPITETLEQTKARLMTTRKGGWLQMFGGDDDPPKSGGGFTREYVEDLRRESADYRTRLRDVEKQLGDTKTLLETTQGELKTAKQGSDSTLTEVRTLLKLDAKADMDAIKAKVAEVLAAPEKVSAKAAEALIKSAFTAAAAGKVINPEAAFKLANLTGVKADLDTLTVYPVDEKGNRVKGKDGKTDMVGLDHLIESTLTEHPYLKGTGQRQSTQVGGGGSNPAVETGAQPKSLAEALAAKFTAQAQS